MSTTVWIRLRTGRRALGVITITVQSVLKNLVRDWSDLGAAERKQCYTPIIDELETLFPLDDYRIHNYWQVQSVLKNLVRDRSDLGAAERKQCYTPIIDELETLFPPDEYRSVQSVLKNLVRDWSDLGAAERKQCYTPIIDELGTLFPLDDYRIHNYWQVQSVLKNLVRDRSDLGAAERKQCYTPIIDELETLFPPDEYIIIETRLLTEYIIIGRYNQSLKTWCEIGEISAQRSGSNELETLSPLDDYRSVIIIEYIIIGRYNQSLKTWCEIGEISAQRSGSNELETLFPLDDYRSVIIIEYIIIGRYNQSLKTWCEIGEISAQRSGSNELETLFPIDDYRSVIIIEYIIIGRYNQSLKTWCEIGYVNNITCEHQLLGATFPDVPVCARHDTNFSITAGDFLKVTDIHTVHPWVHQYVNNITCEHQLLGATFPDVPVCARHDTNFSITAGDFLKVTDIHTVHPWVHQYVNNITCEHQLLGATFPDVTVCARHDTNFSITAGDFLKVTDIHTVHPWVHQYVNNITCEHQLLGATFPDVPVCARHDTNFSITAGDFLKYVNNTTCEHQLLRATFPDVPVCARHDTNFSITAGDFSSPWVHQYVNNITCEHQLLGATFPDVPVCARHDTNFSITAGDFLKNVIEFVERIYAILRPGGYWKEKTSVKTKYAQNPNSMMQHEYDS
ncbi:Uncharacterized protein OBRU01_19132, partial [Operophtera brumata]